MRTIIRNITLLAVLLLLTGNAFAQTIGDFKMDETELYAMTKQMGQFMRRFNYEEDQFGFKLNPKDPNYRSNEMRRKSLPVLFDQEKYGKETDLQRYFIEDVTKGDSTYMTFLGGNWFSEVSCTFKYNGKPVNVMLFLAVEKEGLGSKWDELDFMNIYKAFQHPEVIEYYASKEYYPDYLTLFFYEIKNGRLVFQQVDSVKFHVLQIKDWYFEVSWFNRSGMNSGWLMSNVVYMPEKEKTNLIKFYQP